MVKIWGFLPVRNENVPHISTESLPRNVQNNTGKKVVKGTAYDAFETVFFYSCRKMS